MLPVTRYLPMTLLALVILSSSMLGLSMGRPWFTALAIAGATFGFLLTDHWNRFRVEGWSANCASIFIFLIAMKDFFPEDSLGKLYSIANLLMYLQTILMFQEKTPRLVWQVLVLSLLQVVVAAIFSLEIEGGLLFLLYFVVAGIAMALQTLHAQNTEVEQLNRQVAEEWKMDHKWSLQNKLVATPVASKTPLLMFDAIPRDVRLLKTVGRTLSMWFLIIAVFAGVMFYLVPRHTRYWFGAKQVTTPGTGISKSIDMTNRGQIQQSNELIFRASFFDHKTKEPLNINDLPYFRGMALSSLDLDQGRTNWRAPHDRVHERVYQELRDANTVGRNVIQQKIILEPTVDPLIYAVYPAFQGHENRDLIEFCHEISALTRCRANQKIDYSNYPYNLKTYLDKRGNFLTSFPYVSNTQHYQQQPMSADLPEHDWLTHLHEKQYPTVIRLADTIVKQALKKNAQAGRIEIVKTLEGYFNTSNRFHYTLDFRNVTWRDELDPVEDFVRNHRSGHCELFASALTIMLRSQNIPARLVVGFHGGEYSQLTHSLMVRAKHAHAWVEVYLRPEDCTTEMLEAGSAGPGGAWMILDPTPPISNPAAATVGTEAIELARTVWQDYVLAVDDNTPRRADTLVLPSGIQRLIQNLDLERWNENLDSLNDGMLLRLAPVIIALLMIVTLIISWIKSRRDGQNQNQTARKSVNLIRRLVAGALHLLSPALSQWVLRVGTHPAAWQFYQRLVNLLENHGLVRSHQQTHRQFALAVAENYQHHPAAKQIAAIVWDITEKFEQIRFGGQTIAQDQRTQLDARLQELSLLVRDQQPLNQPQQASRDEQLGA